MCLTRKQCPAGANAADRIDTSPPEHTLHHQRTLLHVQAYFDYLDHTGGFFYERWGDAPVHSLAAVMLLNATEVTEQQPLTQHILHSSASSHHMVPPRGGASLLCGSRLFRVSQ